MHTVGYARPDNANVVGGVSRSTTTRAPQNGPITPDAASCNPLDETIPGKQSVGKVAKPVFGQRSRINASIGPHKDGPGGNFFARFQGLQPQEVSERILAEARHGEIYGNRALPDAPAFQNAPVVRKP
jgi:hypothetical protein